MNKFIIFNRAGLVALASLSSACLDGLAKNDYQGKPLVSISGQVTNTAGLSVSNNIRAAFVWLDIGSFDDTIETPPLVVAQETAVSAEFPAKFHLEIHDLPPKEVLGDVPNFPDNKITAASIVIYADDNNNGHLDLPENSYETLPETILGTPNHLFVIYLEGPEIPHGSYQAPQGFSIFDMSRFNDPDYQEFSSGIESKCGQQFPEYDDNYDKCVTENGAWVPNVIAMDQEIEIPLSNKPKLPYMACISIIDQASAMPLAYNYQYTCEPDNRGYSLSVSALPKGYHEDSALGLCLLSLAKTFNAEDEIFYEYSYRLPDGFDVPPYCWPCPSGALDPSCYLADE